LEPLEVEGARVEDMGVKGRSMVGLLRRLLASGVHEEETGMTPLHCLAEAGPKVSEEDAKAVIALWTPHFSSKVRMRGCVSGSGVQRLILVSQHALG
jgi:hypothetical protein